MQYELSGFLRDLRTRRGLSVEAAALAAGLAASTVRRWEKQESSPRTFELRAILRALSAAPDDFRRAATLAGTPRAVEMLREVDGSPQEQAAGWAPATGELWRALRMRRGMPLSVVARRMGVAASTVSRWENSHSIPPADRLEALLGLLGAREEERDVLSRGSLTFPASAGASVAGCEHELHDLLKASEDPEYSLGDLAFLAMEARIAALPRSSLRNWRLLSMAFTGHTYWLYNRGRFADAIRFADLSIRTGRTTEKKPVFLLETAFTRAQSWAALFEGKDVLKRIDFLGDWAEIAAMDPLHTSIYFRDMAQYSWMAGRLDEAFRLISEARRAAEKCSQDVQDLARYIHAQLLIAVNRGGEALPLLPHHLGSGATSVWDVLNWAKILLATGVRDLAKDRLDRAYFLIKVQGLDSYRADADAIAGLL